jgi:hypothetical protein
MDMENKKTGIAAIVLVSMLGIVSAWMMDPIAQDPEYHLFADQRTILSIPNFWNIISNLPFLLAGVMGLYSIFRRNRAQLITDLRGAYILFFVGISLVAVGSGYYHWTPSNGSLFWDRLPMTIAFMALFSVIIGEFLSVQLARLVLWPLIVFGLFSVIYWHNTEARGAGDLRLYVLVQLLPMLLIPLILIFFTSTFTGASGYWLLLCAYALAKAFEYYDEAIYHLPLFLSGHSFKHLAAAVGVLLLLKSYGNREPNCDSP